LDAESEVLIAMTILSNIGGIAATNAFVIADEASGDAVLFDAPDHTIAPLLDEIASRGWHLIGLWLTHGHFDHVADHAVATKRFPDAKVLIHPLDEPKLKNPKLTRFHLPFTIPPRSADGLLTDGQSLTIGSMPVQVIHTPGHSPGHVCFYLPSEKVLVGGDLIIMGAVGRTDLPDSNEEHLFESLRKVMKLPPGTRLLPGHGHESTLQEERTENPYVQHALRQE
jgi:glyoxylase-like metal-dependent hydrolase (beta-lactamase superfamily II)